MTEDAGRRWDPTDVMLDVSRRVEAMALAMRKHRIVSEQQVCACGQLATRMLPVFGIRCETAYELWDLAQSSMRTALRHMADRRPGVASNELTRLSAAGPKTEARARRRPDPV